jgi:hypothetical protein
MTAIKKTTTKSNPSPAPATKSKTTTNATKPASRSKSKKDAVQAKVTAPVAIVPPPTSVAPSEPPTVKSIVSEPAVTTITARIDIGFGNALYLRGEGPGLSWDHGVPMKCIADDQWQLTLPESSRPYAFKFLVNDLTWSTGPDYTVASGASVTLTPAF